MKPVALLLLALSTVPAAAAAPGEAVRRLLVDVLGANRFEDFDALVAERFVDHAPLRGRARDRAAFRASLEALRRASDFRLEIRHLLAKGPLVTASWRASFRHDREVLGFAPTRNRVTFSGIDLYRVERGVIVERWGAIDRLSLVRQLAGFQGRSR